MNIIFLINIIIIIICSFFSAGLTREDLDKPCNIPLVLSYQRLHRLFPYGPSNQEEFLQYSQLERGLNNLKQEFIEEEGDHARRTMQVIEDNFHNELYQDLIRNPAMNPPFHLRLLELMTREEFNVYRREALEIIRSAFFPQ